MWCALDGIVYFDERENLFSLHFRISKTHERFWNRIIHDLHHPSAHKPFVFYKSNVWLNTGCVAIHEKRNGARWREYGNLCVSQSVRTSVIDNMIPTLTRFRQQIDRNTMSVNFIRGITMHAHDVHTRFRILRISRKRSDFFCNLCGLIVTISALHRCNRCRKITSFF